MIHATKIKPAFLAVAFLLLFLPSLITYHQSQAAAQNIAQAPAQSQPQSQPTSLAATENTTTTAPAAMDLLVIDKDSKQPLPGAAILTAGGAIPRFNGTTDDTGHIHVPLPKSDNYPYFNVAVRAPGFVFKTLRWFPKSTAMGLPVFSTYTLEMEHVATIHGTIVDENNNPIPKASVMLSFDKKFPNPHELYDIGGSDGFVVVKSSPAGTFSYNAAPANPDSISIAASDSTHLTQVSKDFTPLAKLYDGSAALTLHSGGILLDGTVLDQNEHPIPKARIYIQLTTITVSTSSSSSVITSSGTAAQLTDQTGTFAYSFNPGDQLAIYVIAKGSQSDTQNVTITNSPQHLTIHLHPK